MPSLNECSLNDEYFTVYYNLSKYVSGSCRKNNVLNFISTLSRTGRMDGSNYDYQLLLQSAFIVLIFNLII